MRSPKSPFASDLSKVSILLVLTIESTFSPFVRLACKWTSVDSALWVWLVIKHTVISNFDDARISAGLNLVPVRSVKGKGINTISPFTIVDFFQIG